MGLFDIFRRKKKTKIQQSEVSGESISLPEQSSILLAMPMFVEGKSYDLDKVVDHLRSFWKLEVSELSGDSETAAFALDGELIAIAKMSLPIPKDELEQAISYAYLWKDAADVVKKHIGHALVSVMGQSKSQVERYTLLSKLLCSIMMTTDSCIGIYQGNQSLLLQRDYYLAAIDDLQEGRIPVPAWMYIGLRKTEFGGDAYTYGMKDFGKLEFEIIDSSLDAEKLYMLMLNITSYTLGKNVDFKHGDTFSLSEASNVHLNIQITPGVYVEGNTIKLEV